MLARDLSFRGKRVDNGEWVYGNFIADALSTKNYAVDWGFIKYYSHEESKSYTHEVELQTVGQYTGMVDKNGNKIFEGDTVFAWSQGIHAKGSIGQRIDGYWIMYPSYQEGIMWYLMPDSDGRTSIEIIGNIHDKEESNE